jgi:hypothetical protein
VLAETHTPAPTTPRVPSVEQPGPTVAGSPCARAIRIEQGMMPSRAYRSLARLQPARVVATAAVALALVSAWHSGGRVWSLIESDHATYSAFTPRERVYEPAAGVGLDGDIFAFFADFVTRGDRFYVQVDQGHTPDLVRMLAGYWLLPAVEVDDLSKATVVISYFDDPSTLGLHYLTQQEAGLQPIFVSRIKPP